MTNYNLAHIQFGAAWPHGFGPGDIVTIEIDNGTSAITQDELEANLPTCAVCSKHFMNTPSGKLHVEFRGITKANRTEVRAFHWQDFDPPHMAVGPYVIEEL